HRLPRGHRHPAGEGPRRPREGPGPPHPRPLARRAPLETRRPPLRRRRPPTAPAARELPRRGPRPLLRRLIVPSRVLDRGSSGEIPQRGPLPRRGNNHHGDTEGTEKPVCKGEVGRAAEGGRIFCRAEHLDSCCPEERCVLCISAVPFPFRGRGPLWGISREGSPLGYLSGRPG